VIAAGLMGPGHSECNDHGAALELLVMARSVCSQLLMRGESVLVAVAFATLSLSAALAQAEVGPEVAPAQSVEAVPTAPPAAPSPAVEEPAPPAAPLPAVEEPAAPTPPLAAPNTSPPSSAETAPAPLPAGAPASAPPVSTAPAPKGSSAARSQERRSAATLIVVNGRAVPATAVAVLVGAKAVARSGPLASNTRVTLKLPQVKGCRVSVVASFPAWYSAVTRGNINVCKTGGVIVRL
jgi:hypothetical protein